MAAIGGTYTFCPDCDILFIDNNNDRCPLCVARDELEEAKSERETVEAERDDLQTQVENLEGG